MLEVRTFSTVLMGSAMALGMTGTPGAAAHETGAPTPAQESSCFLRGATLAEAADRSSPLGQVDITLNGQTATLCFGRPSARDRTVMGELVPFGEPWRMGANEATAIHLPFAAEIGGVSVPAGSYSIYGIPSESEWEIVINGSAERWGVPISGEITAHDVGSFSRMPSATESMVETLTYSWDAHGESMGHIVMEWENTRVEIPVHAAGSM